MAKLQSALNNISSLERFRELSDSIQAETTRDARTRDEYEGRLLSLVPLRDFIARKMRIVAEMFGVSESYISSVSSTIHALIAHVEMEIFSLRRTYLTLGETALKEGLKEKLSPYSHSFPTGVSVEYIGNMVCDFLKEDCRA